MRDPADDAFRQSQAQLALDAGGEVAFPIRWLVVLGATFVWVFLALFAGSVLWLPGDPGWVIGGFAALVGTCVAMGIWVCGKMWAYSRRYVVLSRDRVVVAGRGVPWTAVTEVASWSVSNGGAAVFRLDHNLPAIGLVLSDDGAREVFGRMSPVLVWLTKVFTLGQWRKYRVVIRPAYVQDADLLLVLLRECLTRSDRTHTPTE